VISGVGTYLKKQSDSRLSIYKRDATDVMEIMEAEENKQREQLFQAKRKI